MIKVMQEEEGDDPEVARTMKRIKTMDAECQLSLRVFALVSFTLALCIYCTYTDSTLLLLITVVCACCTPMAPMLVFPLVCSLVFYILSHIPTMEQIFTVAEDIYNFHEKYKR